MVVLAGANLAALAYQLSDTAAYLDFPAGATTLLTTYALSALPAVVVLAVLTLFLPGGIRSFLRPL